MNSRLLVIPSIDIKDGKTVRVVQGIPELACNEYCSDPVEMAMLWRAENAKCIHVVDFNSTTGDGNSNWKTIEKMCTSVVIPIQVGGGIKSLDDAKRIFDAGVYRIVIGSMFYQDPIEAGKIISQFGTNRVVAAIDSIDNKVVIKGRKLFTELTPEKAALMLNEFGVERFIVTDVRTNGMMFGPNIDLSIKIAEVTKKKVTLSGGVKDKDDLFAIQDHLKNGIDSVIVGRALYENRFPCQRLWRIAEIGIFN